MSCNAKFGSFVCLQTSLKELKLVWKLTVSTEEWHSELRWDSWRFLESRSVENRRRTHRFFRGRGGKVPARTSIILLLLRSSISRATSELSRSAEILEILLFALKTQAEAFRKQISAHRWRASLHASQLSSKQPLGSEVCYLVNKVITNKVFKQKNTPANYADDEAHSLSESAADEPSNFPSWTPPKLQCRSCLC